MNEQEIIEYTKSVLKDIMTEFLFEPQNEDTFTAMKNEIAQRIEMRDNLDFYINIENEDNNIKVVIKICDVLTNKSTEIAARYTDCPVLSDDINSLEHDEDLNAYKRAMAVIDG